MSGTPVVRAAAMRTASSIFAQAGVTVDWRDCTAEGRRAECRSSRRRDNVVVRLMPRFVHGPAARQHTVEALRSGGTAAPPLGFAVVDPETLAGTVATVFRDQIEAVARRTGIERGALLGRVLAHEIGHLLLRSAGHSPAGLMREVWTDEELTVDRPDDWSFAAGDRDRLQRSLLMPAP